MNGGRGKEESPGRRPSGATQARARRAGGAASGIGVETILLDIGDVVVHFDFGPTRAILREESSALGDPLVVLADLKRALELGEIDGATFVSRSVAALGFRGGEERFRRLWQGIFSPNEPMWETIEKLEGRHRLFLLSNTSDLHVEGLWRDFPVFACFGGGVYSFRSRCAKPDPAIYRLAIAELGLEPSATLYVDDRPENVVAGARAGFVSLRYDGARHADFLAEARAYGLAV